MSEVILSGTGRLFGGSPTLIYMRVTGCPQLVGIFVGIHRDGDPFSGTYHPPPTNTATLLLAKSEFDALNHDLANGAQISVSLTYENTTKNVVQFCFPSMCLPVRNALGVPSDSVVPTSGVKSAADVVDPTGTG